MISKKDYTLLNKIISVLNGDYSDNYKVYFRDKINYMLSDNGLYDSFQEVHEPLDEQSYYEKAWEDRKLAEDYHDYYDSLSTEEQIKLLEYP